MPADVERQVRDALRTDAGTAHLAGATLAPIPGGLSNHAWQARPARGAAYFVRLAAPFAERLGADRAAECRILALVSAAGIAPEVVRCDPGRRLLVTRWIEAAAPGTPNRGASHVDAVAVTLARLHALAPEGRLRVVDFAAQAAELETAASADGVLAAAARDVFRRLRSTRTADVVCHHDLHPLNIVWEAPGRPWLVDWEYAGLGDAALDLASFASQHALRAAARRRLVARYLAAGGHVDASRLDLARWGFDYVQWLWYRATLQSEHGPGDRRVAASRATALGASLLRRASSVLRCNNARFVA
jgi:thiamine kinase